MTTPAQQLGDRIASRDAVVGVIGLGYVGLPLALAFAESASTVIGFDTDADKIRRIEAGESYIDTVKARRITASVESGRLSATSDMDRLGEPDAILICVPTPLGEEREPNLRYVESTAATIARSLRPGQLVVLESTTYPGTTLEVLQPILEATGMIAGEDFFLAYSPEREDPGNRRFDVRSIPKVVGADHPQSAELAVALYRSIGTDIVPVSSSSVAEASKLTENIYRAVNIALVNELKMVYERMGVDVWEVLDAAETKPFGYQRFDPGPGWGGHCIPIDPFYLSWKAAQTGEPPRFVELAGRINTEMPTYVLARLETALSLHKKKLAGSRILVLGLAYKRDVADPRESPAFEVLSRLLDAGADVAYHDPHVPAAPRMRSWPRLPALESTPLTAETLSAQDAVLLVTDHSGIDPDLVLEHAPLVVDTRGFFPSDHPKVVRA